VKYLRLSVICLVSCSALIITAFTPSILEDWLLDVFQKHGHRLRFGFLIVEFLLGRYYVQRELSRLKRNSVISKS
jgi:hypothetical protein